MDKKNEKPTDVVDEKVEITEEDVIIEDTDAVVEPEFDEKEKAISDLNVELDETRNMVTKLTAMLQQLQADFDNYRKRNANLSSEAKKSGVFDAVKALLPAFDAVSSAQTQITDPNTLDGLSMVERKLIDSLGTLGITRIKTKGEQFDPNLHNAVVAESVEGVPAGEIVEEYGAGYVSESGDVVRFATVKIAK